MATRRSPACTIIKNETEKLCASEHHCRAAVDFRTAGVDLLRVPR